MSDEQLDAAIALIERKPPGWHPAIEPVIELEEPPSL
jgi:hypothetical protein